MPMVMVLLLFFDVWRLAYGRKYDGWVTNVLRYGAKVMRLRCAEATLNGYDLQN